VGLLLVVDFSRGALDQDSISSSTAAGKAWTCVESEDWSYHGSHTFEIDLVGCCDIRVAIPTLSMSYISGRIIAVSLRALTLFCLPHYQRLSFPNMGRIKRFFKSVVDLCRCRCCSDSKEEIRNPNEMVTRPRPSPVRTPIPPQNHSPHDHPPPAEIVIQPVRPNSSPPKVDVRIHSSSSLVLYLFDLYH
jgi:hypothetical protein